jgi:hypothetical protein
MLFAKLLRKYFFRLFEIVPIQLFFHKIKPFKCFKFNLFLISKIKLDFLSITQNHDKTMLQVNKLKPRVKIYREVRFRSNQIKCKIFLPAIFVSPMFVPRAFCVDISKN